MTRVQAINARGEREGLPTNALLALGIGTGAVIGIVALAATVGPRTAEAPATPLAESTPVIVAESTPLPFLAIDFPRENPFITALKTEVNTPGTRLRYMLMSFKGSVRLMDCSTQVNKAPFSVNSYPGLTGQVDTKDNTAIQVTDLEGKVIAGLPKGRRYSWLAELETFSGGGLITSAISPFPVTNERATTSYLIRAQTELLFAERRRTGSPNLSDHNSMRIVGAPNRCQAIYRR